MCFWVVQHLVQVYNFKYDFCKQKAITKTIHMKKK